MAIGEKNTIVKTGVVLSYSLDRVRDPDDHLLRREVHLISDQVTSERVTVFDETKDVGNKDAWVADLERQKLRLEADKQAGIEQADAAILATQSQIDEIEALI